MSRLLYLQASPRKERSHSRAVADAFVQTYREAHPDDEIVTLDLFEADLPSFDGFTLSAKYKILHGQEHSAEEKNAWEGVETIIEQFTSADKYVLAVPMWNFSIPYRLKQYIDVIVQPAYTFAIDSDGGYRGLVTGKPVLFVCASGGDYSEESGNQAYDMQTRYLRAIFGFMGFTDMWWVTVRPTMGGPEAVRERREAAIAEARRIAASFGA